MLVNGLIVSQMSGSLGGITASHNRNGQYFRARTVPVNPQTAAQGEVRNIFADLTEKWSAVLTGVQRSAWDQYADAIEWQNALGAPIKLSGINHFVRSNSVVVRAGSVRVDDGPTVLTLPGADPSFAVSVSEATQLISVTFDNALAWANEDDGWMQISMSEPVGAGRSFLSKRIKLAGFIDGDSAVPPVSPQTFAAPFAVTTGQQVRVAGRILREDGRLSEMFLSAFTIIA